MIGHENATIDVWPGPRPKTVIADGGAILEIPAGWVLLPPGDAGLTRRVKAAGPTWTMLEKKGRRIMSRGVWAPGEHITKAKADLEAERSTESYAAKQRSAAKRREKVQAEYTDDFHGAVLAYLHFHPNHAELAELVAKAVTTHATPVGSGTVARTKRIPIGDRAAAAVIAWLRHQTTEYDMMEISRGRGDRREVRRKLAQQSKAMLERYRRGDVIAEVDCPLRVALR
ncbi:DUF2293 domain-containing protein [Zavarzinella formosa]|uniref:DUF2293 domain-containing protein n=1 Tax=Zavarzinella formosa TaxID=360055 RepID=UPI0003109595|nr:DUF2293 domain-containing protein [Zavarzinella formosa]